MAPHATMDLKDDLVGRAIRAHCTRQRKAGYVVQQPSANSSYTDEADGRSYVVLVNINGVLAVYKLKNDGHIEFVPVERWPEALELDKVA